VGDAENTILAVAQSSSADPDVKLSLLDSVQKLQQAVANPNVPATVRRHAKKVVEAVKLIVAESSRPAPSETSAPEAPSQTSNPV
jgi:uncharacterized membrane protein